MLDEIKARLATITQGSWKAEGLGSEGYSIKAARVGTLSELYDELGFSGRIAEVYGGNGWPELRANAEFMGAAPDIVRELIALLEEQQQENRAFREALTEIDEYDVQLEHGYVDEWNEATSFNICQKKARDVLELYRKPLESR